MLIALFWYVRNLAAYFRRLLREITSMPSSIPSVRTTCVSRAGYPGLVHNSGASTCDVTVRIEGRNLLRCELRYPAAPRLPMPKLLYSSLGRLGEDEYGQTVRFRGRNADRPSSHPVRLHH